MKSYEKRSIHVVLIENDEEDAYFVKKMLSKDANIQYQLVHFVSLSCLEKHVDEQNADVLLLDLGLGSTQGLQTLTAAKQICPNVPVIVLTAMDEEEFGEQAIEMGAQDYVPKSDLRAPFLKRVIKYALERQKLVSDLQKDRFKDPLTLLDNRASLDIHLRERLETLQRYNEPFAVLFFDLNKFKPVNDTYGHLVGDQVLKKVVQRLSLRKRLTDFLARVGGDEFVLIIPKSNDKPILEQVARSMITLVEKPCYVENNGQLIEVCVGVSVGIAVIEQADLDLNQVLDLADKAMYNAKVNGLGVSF